MTEQSKEMNDNLFFEEWCRMWLESIPEISINQNLLLLCTLPAWGVPAIVIKSSKILTNLLGLEEND